MISLEARVYATSRSENISSAGMPSTKTTPKSRTSTESALAAIEIIGLTTVVDTLLRIRLKLSERFAVR